MSDEKILALIVVVAILISGCSLITTKKVQPTQQVFTELPYKVVDNSSNTTAKNTQKHYCMPDPNPRASLHCETVNLTLKNGTVYSYQGRCWDDLVQRYICFNESEVANTTKGVFIW